MIVCNTSACAEATLFCGGFLCESCSGSDLVSGHHGGTSSPRMAIRTGRMGETHRFNGFNGHFEGLIPPKKNHLNAENDDYP